MSPDSVLKRGSGRGPPEGAAVPLAPVGRWEVRKRRPDRQLRGRHWSCLLPRKWPRSNAGRPRLPVLPRTSHLRQELARRPRPLCVRQHVRGRGPRPRRGLFLYLQHPPRFRLQDRGRVFVSVEMFPKEARSSAVFITGSSTFGEENAVGIVAFDMLL